MLAMRSGTEKGRNGLYVPFRPCGLFRDIGEAGVRKDVPGPPIYPAAPSLFMASMTDFIACDWRASSVTAEDD